MVMSSMSGNVTSTSDMPLNVIFSLMVRSQAMWLNSPSTDSPTNSVFKSRNCCCRVAKS